MKKQYIEKEKALAYIAEQYRLFKDGKGNYGVPHNEHEEGAVAQIDACINIIEGLPTIEIESEN